MRPAWRDLILPIAAVLATGAVAGLAGAFLADAGWRVFFAAGGVVLGLTIVLGWSIRRAYRLARLHVEARRMLSPGHTPTVEAVRALSAPQPDAPDDEVSRLQRTLAALGERMAMQVKETAKKKRNLETLVDTLADPLIVTDQNDEVLLCNTAAEAFFGAGRGTLTGRPVRALFTRREVLDLHQAAHAGATGTVRVTFTTPGGPRVYQVMGAPLPRAWGEGVFGALLLLRDITELAHAVQMQTDFVANASHELRTPIAAIRVASETLQDGAVDDPPMRDKLLHTIDHHAQRLEEMVRDLLDLSRLETPGMVVSLEPISWGELAGSMRQTFEPTLAERRMTLELTIDPRAEGFICDRRLLGLILRNFIGNAAKYGHDASVVRASVQRLQMAPVVGGAARGVGGGGVVRVQVEDRGVGIPLAHQDKVWLRFYQVDEARTGFSSRRGTGLGLAIVKDAATALGGEVGLSSVWGEGTTVWADLPWCDADTLAEETMVEDEPSEEPAPQAQPMPGAGRAVE
jgi:PAS domain S-box-containing protein